MKRALVVTLIIALMILLCGCEAIEQAMHPGQSKIAGMWVDDSEVAKFDYKSPMAEMNGDTYCKKCDKYIAGRVRICPYCGQYI